MNQSQLAFCSYKKKDIYKKVLISISEGKMCPMLLWESRSTI